LLIINKNIANSVRYVQKKNVWADKIDGRIIIESKKPSKSSEKTASRRGVEVGTGSFLVWIGEKGRNGS
jgi:hypothetical protein